MSYSGVSPPVLKELFKLSYSRFIDRFSKTDGSLKSLYASQIVVGDKLALFNDGGDMLQPEEVLEVKEVVEAGSWAPLTTSGTLLVDGFLASCYASFPHDYSEVKNSLFTSVWD